MRCKICPLSLNPSRRKTRHITVSDGLFAARYLLEEAPAAEFESLQERAGTEHGVQLASRDILRESWRTRPEQTSGGDIRSVLRRVGEIDTSADATSARLRRVTGAADAAFGKAGDALESAHSDSARDGAHRDPLRNWLRETQARLRGADTDSIARAASGAIDTAKRTVQAARGVTRQDAQAAAKNASTRAQEAVRTSSLMQSSWIKAKETAGNLFRASKEAYVSRDASVLSNAAREEAGSAASSLKSSQVRLRERLEDEESVLGRVKQWSTRATGLDRTPEELAAEEEKERQEEEARRKAWRGAAQSWKRSALSSVRSRLEGESKTDDETRDAAGGAEEEAESKKPSLTKGEKGRNK